MNRKSYLLLLFAISCFPYLSRAQSSLDESEFFINAGDHYTRVPIVVLDFKAKGAAAFMQISNDKDLSLTNWITYKAVLEGWQLSEGDGEKMVFVKFKDAEGNESKVFAQQIILDTDPPKNPYISVFQGELTNDNSLVVDLKIKADGATFMMLSNKNSFFAQKWQIYQDHFDAWDLEPGEDGMRYVFIKFKDAAQNESAVAMTKIMVDTKPPVDPKVEINKGDPFTIQQNKMVMVAFFARGADSMMVAQNKDFTDAVWEPYAAIEREMELLGDEGKKEIFVKYKDHAGNLSKVAVDDIYLDTTPPTECSIVIEGGAESTNHYDKKVKLEMKATDAVYVKISNKESFYGAQWQLFRPVVEGWVLDGEEDEDKTVYVKFKDKAGNVSSVFSDSIALKRK